MRYGTCVITNNSYRFWWGNMKEDATCKTRV